MTGDTSGASGDDGLVDEELMPTEMALVERVEPQAAEWIYGKAGVSAPPAPPAPPR